MTSKEIVNILSKDGWIKKAQKGSHFQMVHPTKPGKVTIPVHGKELDIRTYNSIMKQAGLK